MSTAPPPDPQKPASEPTADPPAAAPAPPPIEAYRPPAETQPLDPANQSPWAGPGRPSAEEPLPAAGRGRPSAEEPPAAAGPGRPSAGDPPPAAGPVFRPGQAPLPPPPAEPEYPPTTAMPPVPPTYAGPGPGGYAPPYGPPQSYGPLQFGAPQSYGRPPPQSYGSPQANTTPGYGPPPNHYGPPPGYPAPRPPRRNNVPLIAVIVAVVLLLCAGGVTASVLAVRGLTDKAKEAVGPLIPTAEPTFPDLPDQPTDRPDQPDPNQPGLGSGQTLTVEFEVTGDGPAEILYTGTAAQGAQRVRGAKLPWHLSITIDTVAFVSVTAVRDSGDNGSIKCRAAVQGQDTASATREGAFATVSCTKFVYN